MRTAVNVREPLPLAGLESLPVHYGNDRHPDSSLFATFCTRLRVRGRPVRPIFSGEFWALA